MLVMLIVLTIMVVGFRIANESNTTKIREWEEGSYEERLKRAEEDIKKFNI